MRVADTNVLPSDLHWRAFVSSSGTLKDKPPRLDGCAEGVIEGLVPLMTYKGPLPETHSRVRYQVI